MSADTASVISGTPAWSFAELVAPLDPQTFLAEYYDRRPVHLKGDRDRFRDLLSWTRLNELLAIGGLWSADSIDVAIDGRAIPPQQYGSPGMGWDGRKAMVPDIGKLTELLRRGATIAVEKLHSLTPELRALAASMESVLGAPVTSNAFCSWDGTRGYGAHFDTLQVFAIQLEGEKVWEIFEGKIPFAAEFPGFRANEISQEERERQKGKLAMQVKMEPGDMLYVPQGQYHRALASDKSLHLSLGARHYTGVDLINLMVPHLAQVPEFRMRLPHFDDQAEHEQHVKMLAEKLAKVLQDPTVSPTMRKFQREKAFEHLRAFTLPDRRPTLQVRVLWRRFRLERGGDGELSAMPLGGGAAVKVPREVAALVDWAFRRDHFLWPELRGSFPLEAEAALQQKLQTAMALKLMEPI